jgi:hypothetical protein
MRATSTNGNGRGPGTMSVPTGEPLPPPGLLGWFEMILATAVVLGAGRPFFDVEVGSCSRTGNAIVGGR